MPTDPVKESSGANDRLFFEISIFEFKCCNFNVTYSGLFSKLILNASSSVLGVFGITMLIQFISYFFESLADYYGEKGKRVIENQSSH